MRKYIFLILFFVFVTQACTRRPLSVLNPKDMQSIMEDLYIAEAIYNANYGEFKTDEEQKILINSVLLKHDITRAKLDSSLVWYSDNLDDLNKINESVGKSLTLLDSLYRKKAPIKKVYKFSNFAMGDIPYSSNLDSIVTSFTFRIDSTKLYEKNDPDEFILSFDVLCLDTTKQSLHSRFYFQYRDTLIIDSKDNFCNDTYLLAHSIDSLDRGHLKSIKGYIHLTDSMISTQAVLLNKIDLQIKYKQEK